ncbi:MAG: hypothetical protein HUU06_11995 [Planctomycetaceae bacterium]|nr:hypothetical protein [Planctomycetota bacterium]NUN53493.1 hypothetical protein [Planctomycetaceae bacterium]
MADLDIALECDRLRVVAPARLRERIRFPAEGSPGPWEVAVGAIAVRVREVFPTLILEGEDLSILAEGIVRLRRTTGRLRSDEGPYGLVAIRNGRMMAR